MVCGCDWNFPRRPNADVIRIVAALCAENIHATFLLIDIGDYFLASVVHAVVHKYLVLFGSRVNESPALYLHHCTFSEELLKKLRIARQSGP